MHTERRRVHIEKIIAMAAPSGSLRVVNKIRSASIESNNLCAFLRVLCGKKVGILFVGAIKRSLTQRVTEKCFA